MTLLEGLNEILMNKKDLMMIEQTLWLIGNITGDSGHFKQLILDNTCLLETMAAIVSPQTQRLSKSFMRVICWVNCNLNRHKRMTSYQVIIRRFNSTI